jgi:two-component system, OmpR family, phosphate regulon sensor histidine kinase PhoR
MNKKARRELDREIQSQFCANLIGAMPEPAVIVGGDGRLAAANEPAHTLLPALKIGEPLVLALRAPDVLDGLRRVMASGCSTSAWPRSPPRPGRSARRC